MGTLVIVMAIIVGALTFRGGGRTDGAPVSGRMGRLGSEDVTLPLDARGPEKTIVPWSTPEADGFREVPKGEPRDEFSQECDRRFNAIPPRDSERREAEAEWCWQTSKKVSKGYVNYDQRLEKVSLQTARRWWPFANPQYNPQPPKGLNELVYITAKVQRRVDPKEVDFASVDILYEHPDAPAEKSTYKETISRGGIWVHNQHNKANDPPSGPQTITGRPVVVQGHGAQLTEIRPDGPETPSNGQIQGDANIRQISWQEVSDTGILTWTVIADLNRYTERQLISFANALTEIK